MPAFSTTTVFECPLSDPVSRSKTVTEWVWLNSQAADMPAMPLPTIAMSWHGLLQNVRRRSASVAKFMNAPLKEGLFDYPSGDCELFLLWITPETIGRIKLFLLGDPYWQTSRIPSMNVASTTAIDWGPQGSSSCFEDSVSTA